MFTVILYAEVQQKWQWSRKKKYWQYVFTSNSHQNCHNIYQIGRIDKSLNWQ